ncbi:ribosome biogenesis GTPase [Lachnospiraceae bacterium]|nr:ribosome biogenesis GTPase [Lachnospiraceae bacterium]
MNEVRARVIIQEKGLYTLKYGESENIAEVSGKFRYETHSISDYPAVGDYVTTSWPMDGSHSIISGVYPRKSVFIRKAAGTGRDEQVVAANIDTIFICMSLNQDLNLRRLERYVTISWDSGAVPVIVLTKADLCENPDVIAAQVSDVAAGADIVVTSSKQQDISGLVKYLEKEKTYAFIGSSGVGKSTLINTLLEKEKLRTAEIRADDDKGKHTTTHRELIELDNGACVIDTPGMRELGLWNNEEGMEIAFSDIEEMICGCRFSNCTHTNEPGCAIQKALTNGTLEENRWYSYQKLMTENAYSGNTKDYLRAKKAKFKRISKINRKSCVR